MTGPMFNKNFSVKINDGHYSTLDPDRFTGFVVGVMFSTTDLMCLGLMVCASGSMALFLQRHEQPVQHIRSNHRSPEAKATCIILSSFSSFYSLSSLSSISVTLFVTPGQWLMDCSMFVSSCFPTLSPFVLIYSDTRVLFYLCQDISVPAYRMEWVGPHITAMAS